MEHAGTDPQWSKALGALIQDVIVELQVELGRSQLTGRDLINLTPGDVIPLNRFISDDLDIAVEGVNKLGGQPGKYHGNNAVLITHSHDRR
jgi:flagellar motor switch protein FliM